MNSDGYLKLSDFGLSKLLKDKESKTNTICGSYYYLAPEILLNQGYDTMVDWWSFGILIYEMICGIPPFMK